MLLARPPIPQPDDAFVQIFHQSNADARHGLITDGPVDRAGWRRVYEHIGHLAPYATHLTADRYVALEAAQGLGRPTGKTIFGLPPTPEAEANIRRAYRDPIALNITHFFNDVEADLGTPGGSGRWRVSDLGNDPARLQSAYSNALDTGVGGDMESFTISFGVTAGANYFGGAPQILELRTSAGTSMSIAFVNRGGQSGTNRFVFQTGNGGELASPPMDDWLGRQWHQVSVEVDGAERSDRVRLTLSVAGLEDVTATIPRPASGPRRLSIGGAAKHPVSVDDLVISSGVDGDTRPLARYTFEAPRIGQPGMIAVEDDSGNGHTLRAASGFDFTPTSGADPELYAQLKRWLVDELLAARAEAGKPHPEVVTNWRLSERRHRFAAYRPAGFTHGNAVYYLYGPPAGLDKLAYIFEHSKHSLETQWAWEDGSPWNTAWIGNVNPDQAVLTPEDFRSLVALAVLDGNRYFVVFTAMSHGHLGRQGLSRTDAAKVNAEALYAMAEAASWFQGTSQTLEASRYLGEGPLVEGSDEVILRARENQATGELWFAGLATGGPQPARIRLTAPHGTLTNLATEEMTTVMSGTITLTLGSSAEPYRFEPAM
jgi:hypothetical protein